MTDLSKSDRNIKDVIENTKQIFMTDSSINTLLDFERIIDELDIYVFDHWKHGELVEGPKYEKYFVTCTFMWPYKTKPDTRGAERLADYGCVVKYKRDVLSYPMKLKTPNDFQPGTKMPKMAKAPIWLVTITVPKKLMQDIHQGSLELENENLNSEDIEQSYEQGLDDKMYQQGNQAPEQQAQAPAPNVGVAPQPGQGQM
jgi:hypothetical protein